ncbi:MAG: lipopolysaccharide heptosyltransferase II [Nitrospira sp.]
MSKKILIRMPNWIGDAVMAIPTLSALRTRFDGAQITLLAKSSVAALFDNHPDVDRVLVYEDKGKHRGVIGLWRLIRSLRKECFDLAFLLQNAFEAALIAAAAGIPARVGYAADGRSFLLTRSLQKKGAPHHQRESYLALMKLVDGRPLASPPFLVVSEEERSTAFKFLDSYGIKEEDCLIGIHPGAAYGSAKRWLPERFAAVADQVVDRFQAKVVIFGGPLETDIAATVQEAMKTPSLVLAGKTSLREMMALMEKCRLFITNDSGPMHVGSALGIHVVAIFGPTDPTRTSPAGVHTRIIQKKVDCSPCKARECPIDHPCMTDVSSEEVFQAATRSLDGFRGKSGAVFLDRDGTINEDVGYLSRLDQFLLIPGAVSGIAKLNRESIPVFLVTNQSGVGRGFFPEEFVWEAHCHLQGLLAKEGAVLDGIYYCPHSPEKTKCRCRKPSMGMIERAVLEHHVDLSQSYIVGDKPTDMALAREGIKSVLVQTGEGRGALQALSRLGRPPDRVSENLKAAVEWILRDIREETD